MLRSDVFFRACLVSSWAAALGFAGTGCSSDPEGEDESSSSVGSLSASETGDDGADASTTGSGTSDSGGMEGGNPDDGVYAADISIDQIEFNQGTGTIVAQGGQELAPSSYSAPLVGGRPALVRVGVSIGAGFEAREIVARLTLVHTDGTFHELEDSMVVSSDSDMRLYDGAFAIELPADALRGGDRFVVGLFESDESLPGASTPARVPAAGDADLGVWGDPMTAKVVVLPANDPAVDSSAHQLTDAMKAMLEADLYNLYPVQNIEVIYHEPVTITGCTDGANILAQVSGYRNSEGYGANVYYHAIFQNSHENYCWAGGMAWLEDTSQGADRVSYSVNHWGESPNNWTHELGHSHGRPHSFEDTDSYEPNAYPGPDCGHRSTNGYALIPYQHPKYVEWNYAPMATMDDWIIAPTEGLALNGYCEGHPNFDAWGPAMQDVMSYAYPYWISAYTYRNLASHIRTTSAWGDQVPPPLGSTLHVVELGDGRLVSYEIAGAPEFSEDAVQYEATLTSPDGERFTARARPKLDGEGRAHGHIVHMPAGLTEPVSIEVNGQQRTLRSI